MSKDLLVVLVSYNGERVAAARAIFDKLTELANVGGIHDFAIYAGPLVEFTEEEE